MAERTRFVASQASGLDYAFIPSRWGYDTGSLLLHNVLRGDPQAALLSLGDPSNLTPAQRGEVQPPGEGGWRPRGADPWSVVLRTITNPIVLLGFALAAKFPITPKGLIRWGEEASRYDKALYPGWRFWSYNRAYAGTEFKSLMEQVADKRKVVAADLAGRAASGLIEHERILGRSPGYREQIATVLRREGLDDPASAAWQRLDRVTRKHLYKEKYGHLPEWKELYKDGVDQVLEAQAAPQAIASERLTPFVSPHIGASLSRLGEGTMDWMAREFAGSVERLVVQRRNQMMAQAGSLRRHAEKIRIDKPSKAGALLKKAERLETQAEKWTAKSGKVRQMAAEELVDHAENLGVDLTQALGRHPENIGLGLSPREARQQWVDFLLASPKEQEVLKGKLMLGYQPNYYPHYATKQSYEMEEALRRQYEKSVAERRALRQTLTGHQPVSEHLRVRENWMIPEVDDIERYLPGIYSEGQLQKLRFLKGLVQKDDLGQVVGPMFRTYSLKAAPVMEHYISSMSKTISWTASGLGRRVLGEVEGNMAAQAAVNNAARIRYHEAREVIVPTAMGKITEQEALPALAWGDLKRGVYHALGDAKRSTPLRGIIGEDMAEWFKRRMEEPMISEMTWKNAGAKIAGFFYYSALGLNPASAGLNLMQNLITTTGLVPPKHVAKGFQLALKDSENFIRYYSSGMDVDAAFLKAFPKWAQIGSPMETESMLALARARAGGVTGSRVEQAKTILMGMFSASERFNKMWAFHAGRDWAAATDAAWARQAGVFGELADDVGLEVVRRTQFPGGPMGTSAWMTNLWAPLRQFTQFPMRTLELFTSGPGVAGRMMAAGGLTYGAGQLASLDLSRGLLWGALPIPEDEDRPFYPIPFVPPLLGLAGGAAQDILQGSFEQTRRSLPLLVPGGVAAARAATWFAPDIARALGRPYADYDRATPEGLIPVYTAQGTRAGWKTPTRLVAEAVGWKTLTGDVEAEMSAYLIKQRDNMRAAHNEYLEALVANNMTRAQAINERWKRNYPGFGDIPVRPNDIRAVHLRHDVSRIERILETMTPEARKVFGGMVTVALGEQAEQFLGVDPRLLAGGTISQRDVYRTVPEGPEAQELREYAEREGIDLPEPTRRGLTPGQAGPRPSTPFGQFDPFSGAFSR